MMDSHSGDECFFGLVAYYGKKKGVEGMLSQDQITDFRGRLLDAKKDLEKRLQMNDRYNLESGHPHSSVGELSSYDNHPGDEGTELFEREKDLALDEHSRLEWRNIRRALEAIENGTYGICEKCGKEIPYERLDALITATTCKEHSPDQETSRSRPVEEEVLTPPFGKFDGDDRDESVAFDSEDSWQAVAEWGTSETPSDFIESPLHYNDMYIESEENVGYVEDYENFIGNNIVGKGIKVYPNDQHEIFEEALDEEGIMTTFGDLHPFEREPYVEDKKIKRTRDE
ncbi:DNA binding proteinDksA/TraR family [Bacillus smithii]|nr:DNA binding proteinDksA/TraR family [Bacillus smithii]